MDNRLIALLVCPLCKGALRLDHEHQELICAADRLAFPIRNGMAVMLASEAREIEAGTTDVMPLNP
jgi:uncharacterized protein YbaR (Trm112 family)